MTTEELLGETVAAARARESSAFNSLTGAAGRGLVLFGAGMLGRKVLAALRSARVEPLAFADNDVSLQGKAVDGLTVLSLDETARRWGSQALFVVSIFRPRGGEGMNARLQQLSRLGCRWATSFLPLAWRYEGVLPHFGADLPSKLLGNADALRQVAASWADEVSREVFRCQLDWRLRAEFSAEPEPARDQYFPPDLILPSTDELFVDGGAFDGDTLRCLPGGYARAWAFEPDPTSAALLRRRADARVSIFEVALGIATGRTHFDARGTPASSRCASGSLEVPVSSMDELLGEETPTFIKLDVEGDELAALKGGVELLRRSQPVVAVCLYHRPSDLWEIPLYLRSVLPGHSLFLRVHEHDGFELVAYAVPDHRCTRAE